MDFNEYQDYAITFTKYPTTAYIDAFNDSDDEFWRYCAEPIPWLYPALALAEEAGEVAGKLAKYVRKQDYTEETYQALRLAVLDELGDVLWQLSAVAREFDLELGHIAERNLTKLEDRKSRNVIVGEGDSR